MQALVIEGGGMRAAYANGVLAAFEEKGFTEFDAVYGTSAGGALAAWFSAGQADFACDTWRYVEDRRVLSYRRWLTGLGPLLDHDRMFEVIYEREQPLDVKAVERAPHPVVVTVTDADTARTEYVDVRKGPVLAWLRATGRLPLATGPPVEIDGTRWVDGGVTDPVPLQRAIDDGHTDIVLLLNRPPGERSPEPRLVSELVGRRFPACREPTMRHHVLHNEAIRLAENPPDGVRVRIVRPERELGVGRLTRDWHRIQTAIRAGREDGLRFVEGLSRTWPSARATRGEAGTRT